MTFGDFVSAWAHVIVHDTERSHDSRVELRLFEGLPHSRLRGFFAGLDRPSGNLHAGDHERHVVVDEHEQPARMDDVGDDLTSSGRRRAGTRH